MQKINNIKMYAAIHIEDGLRNTADALFGIHILKLGFRRVDLLPYIGH